MSVFVLCPEKTCRQPRFGPYPHFQWARVHHPDQPERDFRVADRGLDGYHGWCDGSHVADHEKLVRVRDGVRRGAYDERPYWPRPTPADKLTWFDVELPTEESSLDT